MKSLGYDTSSKTNTGQVVNRQEMAMDVEPPPNQCRCWWWEAGSRRYSAFCSSDFSAFCEIRSETLWHPSVKDCWGWTLSSKDVGQAGRQPPLTSLAQQGPRDIRRGWNSSPTMTEFPPTWLQIIFSAQVANYVSQGR